MPTDEIEVGRPYPNLRISAYECDMNLSGEPTKKSGGYVRGWYGSFSRERLQGEIVPKLSEYAAQGRSYPFLITVHRLEDKARVHIIKRQAEQRARCSDVEFSRRSRISGDVAVALVFSETDFRFLISE
jgi:hypothetical protein